jgi:dTDP-glucose pyrophosphorylase
LVSINKFVLSSKVKLIDAISAIESSYRRLAVIVDNDRRLLGTITDGDVRRFLLAGGDLHSSVSKAMNPKPSVANENSSEEQIVNIMRKRNVMAVPIIDQKGHFLKIVHLSDLDLEFSKNNISKATKFDFAVIMAGGEGARLRPITKTIPKPMVEVCGAPLLEHQIESLVKAGIKRVYISINYLGHVIEDYFKDGENFGIEICYLREQEKLGTAGALALLPEKPIDSIIVMNGDILTTYDIENLHAFHQNNEAHLTVATINYHVNIPYGTISTEGLFVKKIIEKPSQRFLCNAGIYAISPEALKLVQGVNYFNMTDIIDSCLRSKMSVAAFPLHEYWSDIGTTDDLQKARKFFSKGIN